MCSRICERLAITPASSVGLEWSFLRRSHSMISYAARLFRKAMELDQFRNFVRPYYRSRHVTNWSDGELAKHRSHHG